MTRVSVELQTIKNAIQRCHNPNNDSFKNYGAKGITVCDEWRNNHAAFVEYMGPRPKGCTLDRIYNSQGYKPGNVRWASWVVQSTNRCCVKLLTLAGITLSLTAWAHFIGILPQTIHTRFNRGLTSNQILLSPVKGKTTLVQLTLEHLHASNTS